MKKRRSIIVLLGMIMAGVAVAGFGAPAYAAESAPDTAIAAEVMPAAGSKQLGELEARS